MSTADAGPDAGPIMPGPDDTTELRRRWGWVLVLGVVLLLLGFGAISHVLLAGNIIVLVYGAILLGSGVMEMAFAVWARRWSGFFFLLLDGLLSVVLGGVLLSNPTLGMDILTLVLGIYFLVGGALHIAESLAWPRPHRLWELLSGLVGVALGVVVLLKWPTDSWWFLGLYVGINLIFIGWSLIMLALVARRMIPKTT
jgi:uncharacterized membrane protein HdeD (DUF308 family)